MDIKGRLSVFCITYNRVRYLRRTLEYFINSPIKNVSLTVLDNASTDGSSELIAGYCQKFNNIIHIRHKFNVGGNANICKALELGASSDTDYFWVICDDDIFDFSNWPEVEELMSKNSDLICVCDYVFPNKERDKTDVAYQLFQMSFLPSTIIRRELLSNDIFFNIYDCTVMMFPHLCIPIYAVNNDKTINVLSKPIVLPGHECNEFKADNSFFRGIDPRFILDRKKLTGWILGFSNVLTLLLDKNIVFETLEKSILYREIFGNWLNFFDYCYNTYCVTNKKYLFGEIYSVLPNKIKMKWILYVIKRKTKFFFLKIQTLLEFIFSIHSLSFNKKRRFYVVVCGISIQLFFINEM